jgi:hypothetical protein
MEFDSAYSEPILAKGVPAFTAKIYNVRKRLLFQDETGTTAVAEQAWRTAEEAALGG